MSLWGQIKAQGGSGGSGNVTTSDTLDDGAIILGNGTTDVVASNSFMIEGTGSTSGAVTDDLITFDLGGSAKAYRMWVMVIGFESTTPASAGYTFDFACRTTGVSAGLSDIPDIRTGEEAALDDASADIVASGNNIIIRVTGVVGLDINWRAMLQHISVG